MPAIHLNTVRILWLVVALAIRMQL